MCIMCAIHLFPIAGVCGFSLKNQCPLLVAVSAGKRISVISKSRQSLFGNYIQKNHFACYHQQSGQSPNLLISWASTRVSEVPDSFTGDELGIVFTLTINIVHSENLEHYFYQEYYNCLPTVLYFLAHISSKSLRADCTTHKLGHSFHLITASVLGTW